jgi:Holliday junction resolvasome RuvABC endonuclease subunit
MVKKILGLDLGLKTGWAFSEVRVATSGVQDFSLQRGESPGMVYLRFEQWLRKIVLLTHPDIIVYEQTFVGRYRNAFTSQLFGGLVSRVLQLCAEEKIDHFAVHNSTLKKFACGSGRASKEEMLEKAREGGFEHIVDHNEADATWLVKYATEHLV